MHACMGQVLLKYLFCQVLQINSNNYYKYSQICISKYSSRHVLGPMPDSEYIISYLQLIPPISMLFF